MRNETLSLGEQSECWQGVCLSSDLFLSIKSRGVCQGFLELCRLVEHWVLGTCTAGGSSHPNTLRTLLACHTRGEDAFE